MTLTSKTRPVVRRRAPQFKSKFITTALARLFSQSDSEEEEFQGFSDEEERGRGMKNHEERSRAASKRAKNTKVESEEDSDMDIGFYSDGEEDAPPPRRSLCVAMRFPTKRPSVPTTPEVPQKRAKRTAATRAPPPTPAPPSRKSTRTAASPPTKRSSRTTPSPPTRRSSRRPLKREEETEEEEEEEVPEKEQGPQRVLLSQILKEENPKRELLCHVLKKQEKPQQKPQQRELLSQRLRKEKEEKEKEKEAEQELLPQSLKKRNENIQENKAMLAKLFSELSSMAELTPLTTPTKKKPATDKTTPRKRRFEPESGSERRNPSRKARPPENFGVEEKSESPSRRVGPRTVDIRRLIEVEGVVTVSGGKKRRSCDRKSHARWSQYVVKSVDDITREDLANVAYRAKDKIWDKENGSSCHQCRQKTLDTKTVCRSGFCTAGKGQFCGPCLKNRYGEDVGTVLLDPTWSCPICRNVCNCSLCRKKEGRCATGILVGLARYNGHDNVHEYLERIQKDLS